MKQFKPTHEMIQAANAVFMAKVYVECMKEKFEPIQKSLVDFWKPQIAQKFIDAGRPAEIITEWKRLYLASDEDTNIIFAEYNEEVKKSGIKVNAPGNCPLLEAESLERNANRFLIDVMAPITGFNTYQVLCSKNGLENYKKAIDLTLSLLAPYCKNSLNAA